MGTVSGRGTSSPESSIREPRDPNLLTRNVYDRRVICVFLSWVRGLVLGVGCSTDTTGDLDLRVEVHWKEFGE